MKATAFGACVLATFLVALTAQQRPPAIASISVCSPTGAGGQGSCPSGSFDTHQIVLGPSGNSSVNNSALGVGPAPDEHSTIFAPGQLGNNQDYVFFLASTESNPGIGVAVLSGGSGPDSTGKWRLDYPRTDGYGSYASGFGQVFNAAGPLESCPPVPDGNPAHQDSTFDLNYAAPGSVVKDPTAAFGSLLMVYEGSNACIGSAGGARPGTGSYISLAIATSLDFGKTWPTYRGTPTFSFVPLPDTNHNQGPNAPMGATGNSVCTGNDCTTTPPAAYGRYAVVTPPTSIISLIAAGKPLSGNGNIGEQEISGFIDDVSGDSKPYLYVNSGGPRVARAQLNGGTAPLTFVKWDGHAFAAPGIGGPDVNILPAGPFENCEATAQIQYGSSISYVEDTKQYLLVFVCDSPGDPSIGQSTPGSRGAAWFWSTSYDLSDQSQWTAPIEIAGSWSEFNQSGGCSDYKGFYPTLMSPGKSVGHLSLTGYAFYLWGCQQAGTPPPGRQFSSRSFTITTASGPTLTPGSLANGATYISGGLVSGSWAQVKGSGLSPVSRIWGDADFVGLGSQLPTNLSGVQVTVNSLPAAIYYIDSSQVSFQVPNGVSGTASVQVINNGVASNTISAAAASVSPGIFPIIIGGVNYPAATFLDGKIAGDPANGAAFRKAKPGELVQLYATGMTATPAGVLPGLQTVSGVTVTVGTTTVPADFTGLVAVGEFQINFKLPQLADGTYPISIAVDGVSSPAMINSNPPGPIVLPVAH